MKRRDILDAAIQCVCHDRQDQHGAPENVFATIADMWHAYLHHQHGYTGELTPRDVAQMMVLLKVARSIGNPANADHYVDAAGYSALAAELA